MRIFHRTLKSMCHLLQTLPTNKGSWLICHYSLRKQSADPRVPVLHLAALCNSWRISHEGVGIQPFQCPKLG